MLFQTSKLGGSRGNGGDAEGEDAQSLKKDDFGVYRWGLKMKLVYWSLKLLLFCRFINQMMLL